MVQTVAAEATETPDIAEVQRELLARSWRLLIGGQLVPARSGAEYDDISPINRQVVAHLPNAAADDVDAAAAAAEAALPEWAALPPRERATMLFEMADALERNGAELAMLDSIDIGACVSTMGGDVQASVDQLRMYAGLALEQKGTTIPASRNLHFTLREPVGVVARIIPFNHPAMFAATKIGAPLMAGNTVILKPADIAPLSALRIGELFSEILPPGVLSVVVGSGPVVPQAIVRHPAVRRIGFIGSEATGRAIQKDAADSGVKYVSLELGGKNALIAFPDADVEEVARGAVGGMNFTWSGQSCGSTSRLLVHESIADQVVALVAAQMTAMRIGSPLAPDTQVGTMASQAQYEKSLRYIELAQAEGAVVLAGGGHPAGLPDGYYVQPTLLGGVTPDMRIANEEVFGPVLSVLTFTDEDDAIRIANGVKYGLTASIWTNDIRRAHRVSRRVQAGYVWINGSSQHFLGTPFGGVKASGVGREESLEELLSYTELKTVHVFL
jgi:acyl-CoA reductase-like NAD-dependent aldehyde dehydrogenase